MTAMTIGHHIKGSHTCVQHNLYTETCRAPQQSLAGDVLAMIWTEVYMSVSL